MKNIVSDAIWPQGKKFILHTIRKWVQLHTFSRYRIKENSGERKIAVQVSPILHLIVWH